MDHNCNGKKCENAHHSYDFKNDLSKRLNKIEGQIRGIKKMVINDVYCDDILNQITAARAALGAVQLKLLEGHIKSCVVEQLITGETEVIEELNKTIKRMIR